MSTVILREIRPKNLRRQKFLKEKNIKEIKNSIII